MVGPDILLNVLNAVAILINATPAKANAAANPAIATENAIIDTDSDSNTPETGANAYAAVANSIRVPAIAAKDTAKAPQLKVESILTVFPNTNKAADANNIPDTPAWTRDMYNIPAANTAKEPAIATIPFAIPSHDNPAKVPNALEIIINAPDTIIKPAPAVIKLAGFITYTKPAKLANIPTIAVNPFAIPSQDKPANGITAFDIISKAADTPIKPTPNDIKLLSLTI